MIFGPLGILAQKHLFASTAPGLNFCFFGGIYGHSAAHEESFDMYPFTRRPSLAPISQCLSASTYYAVADNLIIYWKNSNSRLIFRFLAKNPILKFFWAHISKVIFFCPKFIHRRKLIRNYVFRIFDTLSYEAIFTTIFQKSRFLGL